MCSLGEPLLLREDILPTRLDVYNHYLHLMDENGRSGKWKQNTLFSSKVKCVRDDVVALWDRTFIPHDLAGRHGEKKVSSLLTKCRTMTKVWRISVRSFFYCLMLHGVNITRMKFAPVSWKTRCP